MVVLVEALGATRIMGSSRDFQDALVPASAKLLTGLVTIVTFQSVSYNDSIERGSC